MKLEEIREKRKATMATDEIIKKIYHSAKDAIEKVQDEVIDDILELSTERNSLRYITVYKSEIHFTFQNTIRKEVPTRLAPYLRDDKLGFDIMFKNALDFHDIVEVIRFRMEDSQDSYLVGIVFTCSDDLSTDWVEKTFGKYLKLKDGYIINVDENFFN